MIAEWLAKVISVDVPRWGGFKPFPSAAGGKACRWMVSFIRWTFFICGTPFAIWAACAYLPEPWVRGVGQAADLHFWSWIKTTDYARCTNTCRDLTFGMIALPVSWIVTLVGMTRLRSIAVEMEEQEKDWLYSPVWVEMAKAEVRSSMFREYGTPLFDGKAVFFFCFWIFLSYLMAGEIWTRPDSPPRAFTGLPIAFLTAFYSFGIAAHGMQQTTYETLSRWRKKNQSQ
ncbi:MAG: hypothetical protein EPO10_24420 [Reyranella sp.]|uniref:hypothetical protein n=1 Tax=Reyranella sp. TaxID=1929291 RepID=UPI0011FB4F61|nr:hypothetical protein [Reyranella sp.]TAJ92669.1 MAG: hypothetical protein EPO41_13685 [Reyranella sp.]TBR25374.1 MAG: hypothetical protein EPO10_24420 [Reyranella sp.]